MIKTILFLLLLFLTSNIWSQQLTLNLQDKRTGTATLSSLSGEKLSFIDSISVEKGELFYNCENLNKGFYRLLLDKQNQITFIFDGVNIKLTADADNISETLEVIKSESNRIYYTFVELNRAYKTKTELLRIIVARYPQTDEYYEATITKIARLQKEYSAFIDSVNNIDSSSFIARYIQSSQLPIIDYTQPIEEQIAHLKSHALVNVDFDDAELIYSDCFTNKSIEYLTYYQNPQLPKGLLEQEFQKAVDTLLTKASVNILVYEQIADYLVDGFKQFGFDNVVDYIIENYVVKDDLCLDEQTENSIESRINQSKLLKIGTTAPNIVLPDTSGKLVDLSKIEKEKTLLLFYASWCPHCQDMLPQIHNLFKQHKDLEVVAISLDDSRDDWITYLKDNSFSWINLSDLKGWESKAAQDYYIYATPTMFLLNSNREIIGKPLTTHNLKILLR
jgi:peroxiredoxin